MSRDTTVSVPRPLKLRTGFIVSTFSTSEHPSASLNGRDSYCGEPRNTASIDRTATRIRSRSRRPTTTTVRADPGPGPAHSPPGHERAAGTEGQQQPPDEPAPTSTGSETESGEPPDT